MDDKKKPEGGLPSGAKSNGVEDDSSIEVPNPLVKEKEARLRKAELYENLSLALMHHPAARCLPPFPAKYHVNEVSPGVRQIVMEGEDGVCKIVPDSHVVQALLSYCHRDLLSFPDYCFTHSEVSATACFWRDYAHPIAKPAAVKWASDEGLTFRRLPWNRMNDQPTPLFDELMGRTSNALALCYFIGSLFDPGADRQQYVWMRGDGQDGKSSLARFIRRVFGNSVAFEHPPSPAREHFWVYNLLNKRLVVFPDCNAVGFPVSGLFKSLTGDDPVRVEEKGQPAFTAELEAKFMFLSNDAPRIESGKADMRRIILCEMAQIKGEPDPGYEEALWREGGAFLSKCIDLYERDVGRGRRIPVDTEQAEDLAAANEEPYEEFIERYLDLEMPTEAEGKTEGQRWHVRGTEMQRLMKEWSREKKDHSRLKKYLDRAHGIRRKTIKTPTGWSGKAYVGCLRKQQV